VRVSAWGEVMVGLGAMAVVLLALNSAVAGWHPMVRFVVAIGVALAVVSVVRRFVDTEAG
jgi:hypothetical protein